MTELSPLSILMKLPKTNCKKCGLPTCMAFAVSLIQRKKELEECTPLFEDAKYAKNREELQEMLKPLKEVSTETGLIVNEDLCFGCGNCVIACPVNVAEEPYRVGQGKGPQSDKYILHTEDGVVKAINVKSCRRFGEHRVLCEACIVTCPSKAIKFV
ncbi:MAG: (Fe-S)-binding protein [Candidatus Hydrothermarchaeota archaeon]